MLAKLEAMLARRHDRASFFDVVGDIFPETSTEYVAIASAYKLAKEEFRELEREEGVRYFEHLRAVALIDMMHLRVRDHEMIIAALLHDIVEDIPGWTIERVQLKFGRRVAELLWWLTKPPVGADETKLIRNSKYHNRLNRAGREVAIIKLADRLHNLLTLWACEPEKQRRKVQETIDFFLPLAERHIVLIHELEEVLERYNNGA